MAYSKEIKEKYAALQWATLGARPMSAFDRISLQNEVYKDYFAESGYSPIYDVVLTPPPTDVYDNGGTASDVIRADDPRLDEQPVCPEGWILNSRGVCQPSTWGAIPIDNTVVPVETPTTTGGSTVVSGGATAPKPVASAPTSSTPAIAKPIEKKWIFIGIGILVVAIVGTYFIAKS